MNKANRRTSAAIYNEKILRAIIIKLAEDPECNIVKLIDEKYETMLEGFKQAGASPFLQCSI